MKNQKIQFSKNVKKNPKIQKSNFPKRLKIHFSKNPIFQKMKNSKIRFSEKYKNPIFQNVKNPKNVNSKHP